MESSGAERIPTAPACRSLWCWGILARLKRNSSPDLDTREETSKTGVVRLSRARYQVRRVSENWAGLVLMVGVAGCATIVMDDPEQGAAMDDGGGSPFSGGASSSGGSPDNGIGGSIASGGLGPGSGTGGRIFGPGPGTGGREFGAGGGVLGTGGVTGAGGGPGGGACTQVNCSGSNFPPPQGASCFEFETSAFGGWQVSSSQGCVVTFDGQPAGDGQNPVAAGSHTLRISGCTSSYVTWNCWF